MSERDSGDTSSFTDDVEGLLEYLRRTHPDLARKFGGAEELREVLSARDAYRALRYEAKGRATTALVDTIAGFLKEHWAILAIFLLALSLRIPQAIHGLPYLYPYDEIHFMARAIRMLKTGDLNPQYFNYPSLLIYLQFIVAFFFFLVKVSTGSISSLDDIRYFGNWDITTPDLYLWGRIVTCLLGALTAVVVYLLARFLFKNKNIALAAALFLAVSPGHIDHSGFITVDVPTAFMVTLATYLCARILQEESLYEYCFAGFACGLSISTKYNVYPIVVPYLFAAVGTMRIRRNGVFKSVIGLACIGLGFLAATPFALLDMGSFVASLGYVGSLYGATGFRGGSEGGNNWIYHSRFLFSDALGLKILFLLACGGIVYGLSARKLRKQTAFLVIFPLMYFCYMSVQKAGYVRNMMPVVPFLAIFAAVPLSLLERRNIFRASRVLPLAVAIILALPPAALSLGKGWRLYHHKDTRIVAAEWMRQNIPPGAKVAFAAELHFYFPTLSEARFEVVPMSQRDVDLSDLRRRLGIEYFVAGRFKEDRCDEHPLVAFDRPFTGLEPIHTLGDNIASLGNPVNDPAIYIYRL